MATAWHLKDITLDEEHGGHFGGHFAIKRVHDRLRRHYPYIGGMVCYS